MTNVRRSNLAQPYVSVKQFGAVGDGVTDDTAAIQAALNAASQIVFPAGDYVSSAVYITSATKRITGLGKVQIIQTQLGYNLGAFNFRGGFTNITNVSSIDAPYSIELQEPGQSASRPSRVNQLHLDAASLSRRVTCVGSCTMGPPAALSAQLYLTVPPLSHRFVAYSATGDPLLIVPPRFALGAGVAQVHDLSWPFTPSGMLS